MLNPYDPQAVSQEKIPSLIAHIKKIMLREKKPAISMAWKYINNPEEWQLLLTHFQNHIDFFKLSPYFFAKAENISILDFILKKDYDSELHSKVSREIYQKRMQEFWEIFRNEDFSQYIEIHADLLKTATSYELYCLLVKCPTILRIIINRGYLEKLLAGSGSQSDKSYLDYFLLLRILLEDRQLTDAEKILSLHLIIEHIDISNISYCTLVRQYANNEKITSECFPEVSAKLEWLLDKDGQPFNLKISKEGIDFYIEKLRNSFPAEKFNSVLLKAIIYNLQSEYLSELVNENIRAHVKTEIKNISVMLQSNSIKSIDPSLKRDLENCLFHQELRKLFAFTGEELYALMQIPDLNPVCYRTVVENKPLYKALFEFATAQGKIETLYKFHPFFHIDQFCEPEMNFADRVELLVEVMLMQTGMIKTEKTIITMHNDLIKKFDYARLCQILAKDSLLRNAVVEKFSWPNRQKFKLFPIAMFISLTMVEIISDQHSAEEKLDICLELISYGKLGYLSLDFVDNHMQQLLEEHTDLLVAKALEDKEARQIIFDFVENNASEEKKKSLITNCRQIFGTLALSKEISIQPIVPLSENKVNICNVVGIGQNVLHQIQNAVHVNNINKVNNILTNFMEGPALDLKKEKDFLEKGLFFKKEDINFIAPQLHSLIPMLNLSKEKAIELCKLIELEKEFYDSEKQLSSIAKLTS